MTRWYRCLARMSRASRIWGGGTDRLVRRSAGSADAYQPRGSIYTMRTTIDKAGRLVIPRSLRNRIGLVDGGEVELELDGAAVRIEPVVGRELREDGGLLFIPAAGTPITDAAARELIDADRHGR